VRGIAVLLVFAFHVDAFVHFPFMPSTTTLPGAFVRAGHTGVDLFFVLSGFLITTLLLEEWERGRRISLRSFYLRRARRLLPALFTLLALLGLWLRRRPRMAGQPSCGRTGRASRSACSTSRISGGLQAMN